MAANTDLLRKSKTATSTTLGAGGLDAAGTSCALSNVTNWPTDTAVTIIVDRVDADGVATPDKMEEITGVLNGSTFENLLRGRNHTTAQAHAAGAIVELAFTGSMLNDIVDWGLEEHDQDGTHSTAFLESLQDMFYPVGSIYINAAVDTNPATLLGFGTWEAFGAGKVMVGQDTADTDFDVLAETGGAKTVTLTSAQIPSHTHTFSATTSSNGSHEHNLYINTFNTFQSGGGTIVPERQPSFTQQNDWMEPAGAHTHTVSGTTGSTGTGNSHTNVQPYIVVKAWKRTA